MAPQKLKVIRKHTRKDPLDDNRKLLGLAKESSRKAVNELLQAGISVVYLENGQLVEKGPNQEITVVRGKKSAPNNFSLKDYLCQG